MFAHVCPRVKLMNPVCVVPKTIEEEMFDNRMSIEQLLRADWKNESKVHFCHQFFIPKQATIVFYTSFLIT